VTHAERYLELGLRLGRHVDGLVDAYYGPPELKEQTDREPVVAPAQLAGDGEALLAELPDGWLRDQVRGCTTYARVLEGDAIAYIDEVEQCYGVRPVKTPTSVYEAAHAQLDELLPGDGSLFERRQAWRTRHLVDGTLALAVLEDLLPLLRERTEAVVPLPEGERLTIEPVHDEPWWAFNYYLGDLRSRVVLNLDVPTTGYDLIRLAAHEVYPGHHTEHALKEQLLLRDRGAIEEGLQLVPTPQALLSEGIAEAGADVILDGESRHPRAARHRDRRRADRTDRKRARAARDDERRRGAPDSRGRRLHRGRATLHRALAARHAGAGRAQRALRHRSDLARLHDYVHRRRGAVPRVRGWRPGSLPPPADRARTRRRPARRS
jgi:hypothetical protein